MSITLIGLIVSGLGVLLYLRGSSGELMILVMMTSLMNGSAAAIVSGLSIQPVYVSLAFLTLRILMSRQDDRFTVSRAFIANGALWVFAFYALIGAVLLPRIFAGQIYVTPMNFDPKAGIFATVPLAPTSQNISTVFYLFGTVIAATACFHTIGSEGDRNVFRVVRWASIVAITQAVLGLLSIITVGTPFDVFFEFFRNAGYAQLEQSFDTLSRMNGIAPEPSGYANTSLPWFILCTELWLRRLDPVWSGTAAATLGFALLLSTSSTAYAGISIYVLVVALRMLVAPKAIPQSRLITVIAIALTVTVIGLGLAVVSQAFLHKMQAVLAGATLEKADSESGRQRLFWSMQGIWAFFQSFGLGIGPGSFRSSSSFTAIIGSTGLIGTVAFLYYQISVLNPTGWGRQKATTDSALASAFGWAGTIGVIPVGLTGPSANPGLIWGIICGLALAMRSRAERASKKSYPKDQAIYSLVQERK